MKRLLALIVLPLAIFSLTSCGTGNIITSSENSIVIDIRGTGWTTSEMLAKSAVEANKHCEKYNKKANLENTTGFFGAASTVYFSCK